MTDVELLGYAASLLVLATFCMRDLVPLRALAIASNLAFVGYAALAGIHPVLLLHALLLPMNAWRLIEAMKQGEVARAPTRLQTLNLGEPSLQRRARTTRSDRATRRSRGSTAGRSASTRSRSVSSLRCRPCGRYSCRRRWSVPGGVDANPDDSAPATQGVS